MLAMRCDRCGKYSEANNEKVWMRNCIHLYRVDNYDIVREKEYYDLCPECMAKLKEFLKGAEMNAKV